MNIVIAVAVLNQQEITQTFLRQLRETEGECKIPILVIDNGSTPPVRDWLVGLREGDMVIRNSENRGVLPALNQAYAYLKNQADYIFNIHNDVLLYEQGWSDKLVRILEQEQNVGVAGFFGAKQIGLEGIYRVPYTMFQLIRVRNVSGCVRMNPLVHNFREPKGEVEDVAVMDGFSLIVRVELLHKTGGYDRTFPIHHMYDNDICLESLDKGYRNIVIKMDADHVGGRTDVGEDWASPFDKTKQQVHEEAHPIFYEKWRPGKHTITLPVKVI
jgi:GT2 family glycosyltransferase